jgi:hypothetical protein
MVSAHKPISPDEIEKLISQHISINECEICGCRSKGTIKNFSTKLFDAQSYDVRWRSIYNNRYSWDDCYRYMRELFCEATYVGVFMEATAFKLLEAEFPELLLSYADSKTDLEQAVDIIINTKDGTCIAGVQVKPQSIKHRRNVLQDNYRKNKLFCSNNQGAPVHYLFYDNHNGRWINDTDFLSVVRNSIGLKRG